MKQRGIRNYSETLERWFDIIEDADPLHHGACLRAAGSAQSVQETISPTDCCTSCRRACAGQLFPSQVLKVLEKMEIKILPEVAKLLRTHLKKGGGHMSTPMLVDLLCEDQLHKKMRLQYARDHGGVVPSTPDEEASVAGAMSPISLDRVIVDDVVSETIGRENQGDLFKTTSIIDVLMPIIE